MIFHLDCRCLVYVNHENVFVCFQDLHRTGCSGYSGEDSEAERALLKRILLAYARWNKAVGYCQGFNVIAALLLDVMDRKEADALKVSAMKDVPDMNQTFRNY